MWSQHRAKYRGLEAFPLSHEAVSASVLLTTLWFGAMTLILARRLSARRGGNCECVLT